LEIAANAPNVIPGEARLTVELRDLSPAKLQTLAQGIRARARDIAAATGLSSRYPRSAITRRRMASSDVQAAIERAGGGLSLEARRLPSGARHDAPMMAQLGPMGMIFVPSAGGVSHSPKELTSWDECARGALVPLPASQPAQRLHRPFGPWIATTFRSSATSSTSATSRQSSSRSVSLLRIRSSSPRKASAAP
jgi:N-carbamoyl-L-amino-acid hydrolase